MKKIRVGLDFDGVVAYNPVRIFRAPVAWIKKRVLKKEKTSFFVPKKRWQKWLWVLIHKTSYFPALGSDLLREMAKDKNYEFHLVTARFDFLKDDLDAWLKRQKLTEAFKTINVNLRNEQPHVFKERVVKKLDLDYFVEDNLDIVLHLERATKAKIMWVYNLLDRRVEHESKHPHLKGALRKLKELA